MLELLDDPLRSPCALGEHGDDLPFLAQAHGGLDSLNVAFAAAHRERASGSKGRAQDGVEELDLRHEMQLAMWPEGKAEWPRVEVGGVVRREHEATLSGEVVDSERLEPVRELHHRPADRANEDVERGRLHKAEYLQERAHGRAVDHRPRELTCFAGHTASPVHPCRRKTTRQNGC